PSGPQRRPLPATANPATSTPPSTNRPSSTCGSHRTTPPTLLRSDPMKLLRHALVISLLCSAPVLAQTTPSGGYAKPTAQATPAAPARAFPAWEQLSAAEREMLVAPVRERWNSNPEARARMMDHAQRWQTMTPEQRQRAHHGMKRWASMTPEQRQELRAKWKAMTPAERDAWIKAHPAQPR